jgi:phospholipid/cholesterol/gamma-HCH transport system substrate-binding protein
MEKSTSEKIQLAIFVIVGLIIFILAVYYIGNKQKMFGKTNHLKAVFNNVSGLQLGNNVRYSGINIGTVRGIQMINDTTITVDMIIDDEIFHFIKKDAIATINSDGLVGSMIVNILPGKGNAALIKPGDTIQSTRRVRSEDMINTLSSTNKNIEIITKDLLKITQEMNSGKGTVGMLLKDSVLANNLKITIQNIKIASDETSKSVKEFNTIMASLNNKNNVIGILNDTIIANKLKATVINLEKSSKQINQVVANLNATILNAKDGKGAINYLSNNPELVQKIDSTMTNINSASIKLNEDLEALKSNFLLRGYFKKQEKTKNK